jgi:hypothetical protein
MLYSSWACAGGLPTLGPCVYGFCIAHLWKTRACASMCACVCACACLRWWRLRLQWFAVPSHTQRDCECLTPRWYLCTPTPGRPGGFASGNSRPHHSTGTRPHVQTNAWLPPPPLHSCSGDEPFRSRTLPRGPLCQRPQCPPDLLQRAARVGHTRCRHLRGVRAVDQQVLSTGHCRRSTANLPFANRRQPGIKLQPVRLPQPSVGHPGRPVCAGALANPLTPQTLTYERIRRAAGVARLGPAIGEAPPPLLTARTPKMD